MLIFYFFLSFSSPHEGKGKEPENKMTKEEEEKIAELGKPRLGEITKISCHIRESMEFKVQQLVYLFTLITFL